MASMIDLRGRIALGTAAFGIDGATRDRVADIGALRVGLDAGAIVVDTARAYSTAEDESSGELLVADAVDGRPDVVIMTKGGHWRAGDSEWRVDNTAARLRADAVRSLKTLGVPRLDVYLLHRTDAAGTDLDAALDALVQLRDEGVAARIGLSNVSAHQLRVAVARGAVDVVQNLHGPTGRDSAALAIAEQHGIPYFAYSPLRAPRDRSLADVFPRLAATAEAGGVPLPRLVLRGVLAESPVLSVVTGATRPESIVDSVAAARTEWSDRERAAYDSDVRALRRSTRSAGID